MHHSVEKEHFMALSFSDLSVWCYCCDNYVDNNRMYDVKNAAHKDKFGEEMLKIEESGTASVTMVMQ